MGAQPRRRLFLRPTGMAPSGSSALADISILFLSLLGWGSGHHRTSYISSPVLSAVLKHSSLSIVSVFPWPFSGVAEMLRGSGPA